MAGTRGRGLSPCYPMALGRGTFGASGKRPRGRTRPRRHPGAWSELTQHVLGARDGETSRLLHVQLLHDRIVDDHRETLAALAHAEFHRVHFQSEGACEIAVAVG